MTPDQLREEAKQHETSISPSMCRLYQVLCDYASALEEVERLNGERDEDRKRLEEAQSRIVFYENANKFVVQRAEKAEAELAEARRDLQFVERWANHHGVKPHTTAKEVLSMIQHYPPIRAITEGYSDGKIPDTPNPWEQAERRAERLKHHAGALWCCLVEAGYEQLEEAQSYRAEFKEE